MAGNPAPYWKQGTQAFDNSPIRKRRLEISRSAKIRTAAQQFWVTSGLSPDQAMPRDTYLFIHRRISKALAPELTEEEAQEAAEDDWLEDLDGADDMHLEQCALPDRPTLHTANVSCCSLCLAVSRPLLPCSIASCSSLRATPDTARGHVPPPQVHARPLWRRRHVDGDCR